MPFVRQLEVADCGAACLAMTLQWHGRIVALQELRECVGTGAIGARASAILDAGERYGLRGRGVRLEPDALHFLPRGSILHWALTHFVVYDGISRRGVRIVDPAGGHRVIGHEAFGRQFTGVALIFEPGEDFRTGGRRDHRIWDYYFRRIAGHRGELAQIATASVLVQFFGLALPLFIGILVDRVVPVRDHDALVVVALGAFSLVLFQILAVLTRAHLLLHLRTRLEGELLMDFMHRLMRLPYGFFIRRTVGDLIARYLSNRMIQGVLTGTTLSALFDGAPALLYLVLVLAISPALGLLVAGLALLQLFGFLSSYRQTRTLQYEELEAQAQLHGQLQGMIQGIESLKASGSEQRALTRWSHRLVDALNVGIKRDRLGANVDTWRFALEAATPLSVLIAGAWLVLHDRLTLGTMLAASGLAAGFLRPFGSIVATAVHLQKLRGHVDRVQEVIATPPEASGPVSAAPAIRGDIAVERVSFRYDSSAPEILRDVSLDIPAGRAIAIVGRSGAGKSTLARLLVGLESPTTGRILYDGRDLRELDLTSVRSQIGIVTQRAHLFGTTIRDNIALFDPDVSQEAIVGAAMRAEIHDDIQRLPMRYETPLLDGAPSLSGGQKQRIVLARALVRRPTVLLLDEATSELDAVTESRIMAGILELGCTRVIIAHRLSTVVHADLIVVLDQGRVSEAGTHRELVGANGVYSSLVAAQSDSRG